MSFGTQLNFIGACAWSQALRAMLTTALQSRVRESIIILTERTNARAMWNKKLGGWQKLLPPLLDLPWRRTGSNDQRQTGFLSIARSTFTHIRQRLDFVSCMLLSFDYELYIEDNLGLFLMLSYFNPLPQNGAWCCRSSRSTTNPLASVSGTLQLDERSRNRVRFTRSNCVFLAIEK